MKTGNRSAGLKTTRFGTRLGRAAFLISGLIASIAISQPIAAQNLNDLNAEMMKSYPKLQGTYFELTTQNSLPENWIFSTPDNLIGKREIEMLISKPGDFQQCITDNDCSKNGEGRGKCSISETTISSKSPIPKKICLSQSQRLVDEFYNSIQSARHSVDMVYLGPPGGRFEKAIINALARNHDRSILVRILVGSPLKNPFSPGGNFTLWNTQQFLERVKSEIPDYAKSKIIIEAGHLGLTSGITQSWIHSKILLVDGETVMVGGHNLDDAAYLGSAPTFDLSIKVAGAAALSARKYVNRLWDITNTNRRRVNRIDCRMLWPSTAGQPDIRDWCDFKPGFAPRPPAGDIPVMAVANTGLPFEAGGPQPSRDAMLWMIRNAKSSIKLSQQDVVWGAYPHLIEASSVAIAPAIARRALDGVSVYLVLSNPLAAHGMSHNYPIAIAARNILFSVQGEFGPRGGGAKVRELLCKNFHLSGAYLNNFSDKWSSTNTPFGNHAKFVMADDRIFYVGSDNMYDPYIGSWQAPIMRADLQENGLVIDSQQAGKKIAADYFDQLWDNSKSRAVSGSSVPTEKCIFMKL